MHTLRGSVVGCNIMALFIGITLALAVGGYARWTGLDRDRAFYPTAMIVIASYYVLFAVMAESPVLLIEIAVCVGFVALATLGFKTSLWFVVAALAAHGTFDFVHPHVISESGAPRWWPEFCGAYDIAAAGFLGFSLIGPKRAAAKTTK